MAKQFGGFTPEQLGKIDPAMAGMQADEQVKYMAANPGVSSRVGNMAQQAKKRISMASGGYVNKQGYAAGGITEDKAVADARAALDIFNNTSNSALGIKGSERNDKLAAKQEALDNALAAAPVATPNTTGGFDLSQPDTGNNDARDQYGMPILLPPDFDPDYGTKPVETPITSPVETPVIDDGPTPSPAPQQAIKGTVTFETPKGSYNYEVKRKTMVDGSTRMLYTVKDAKGSIVATDLTGSDMQKWAADNTATPRDVYDPSKGGLPTSPEGVAEAAYTPFLEQVAGGSTGAGAEKNIPGITKMLSSGNVPEDPTDYEITGGERNWTITYADGTSLKSIYKKRVNIENEAANIASVLQQYKESDTYTANTAAQKRYNTELEQYKTYSGDQAGDAAAAPSKSLEEQVKAKAIAQNLLRIYSNQLANLPSDDPQRAAIQSLIDEQAVVVSQATAGVKQAQSLATDAARTARDARVEDFAKDPTGSVTDAAVVDRIAAQDVAKGEIAALTGDAGEVTDVIGGTVIAEGDVADPTAVAANTYTGESVLADTKEELLDVKSAESLGPSQTVVGQTGDISTTSIADEAMQVDTLKILKVKETTDLLVATNQLAEFKGEDYAKVVADVAVSDTLTEAKAQIETVKLNELPTAQVIAEENMAAAKAMQDAGLAPDAIAVAAKLSNFAVTDGTLALAMEGSVQALDTVEGQLSKLMKSFDDGTPSWASGAIRAANAAMAGRGLGASSMASAAILNAAMESALPIAQQDAQVFNNMNLTNLSNRQQVSLSNAAAQQGLSLANLSNQQQANLQKSANAFSLQTQNLSNRQTVELSNAQIRATLQGKNLDNQQQSNIITAARYAEAANINLSNKQQASMQDSMGELQTNLANLSSKSQSYITSANLEANLQGQVLTNDQQVAVLTAARYSESANMTFSADQQRVLHNSSLMQSIGLAELNAQQAAVLQNAANSASMDMADLSNLQQAQVENAKNFLNIDLANLSNDQQTIIFKAQATQQALLSDQASLNSSKQFNAASKNQKDQFDENLKTQVSQFNVEQGNAMERFTVEQGNAISTFNKSQENARSEFNASQALVIEQSNAVWNQNIVTAENAAAVAAAAASAQAANEFSAAAAAADAQAQRDQASFSFQTANNNADRVTSLAVAQLAKDGDASAAAANKSAAFSSAIGAVVGKIITG